MTPSSTASPRRRYGRSRIALFIVGVFSLAALIGAVLNFGEINAFARQAADASPEWLGGALLSQCGAFLCAAFVWWVVLHRLDHRLSLLDLTPLSVAKLFADQALPSGGLSGAFFILQALRRRGVEWDKAFTAFVFGAATFIAAFLIAAAASIAAIAQIDHAPDIVTRAARGLGVLFSVVVFIAALVFLFAAWRPPRWLSRRRALRRAFGFARLAAQTVASAPFLFLQMILIQLVARSLDALTMWLVFFSIGADASIIVCFIAISIASVASTIAPTPMGLGAFEAGMLAVLKVYGVPVETALTVTLLYRGFTLWLPLLIGFFVMQHEWLLAPPKFKFGSAKHG